MKKAKGIFFLLFLVLFLIPNDVQATTSTNIENIQDKVVEESMDALGLENVQGYWEQLMDQYGGYLPESQRGTFSDFVKGEGTFSLKEWFISLLKFLFYEVLANGKLMGTLIVLTIFSAVLNALQSAFEKSTVSKIAEIVIFLVLIVFTLNSFHLVTTYTLETIEMMIGFVLALLPLLLGLIATTGSVLSAAFFHPLILFLMNTSGLLMKYFVLPLFLLAAILNIVSQINSEYKVTSLANLLNKAGIWLISVFLTIFLGVISVQGTATAISDGLAVKTAKFVTSNFIPVVGRAFTEATDTVISASAILKNMVGISGVVILLLIAAFPALKIFAIALIYKFTSAVLQPIAGGSIVKCLDVIGKSILYVFTSLAIVSLMFFLCITVIITAGNITMMMR
ncbi:MAG: stage III sporulation protein AE [Bacillaceae bacterium]